MTTPALRRSPLHDRHAALGAKTADFGGWDMPIEYAGGGVVREHTAVREDVGVFDVSHLGKLSVRGEGARALLDSLLTNDVGRVSPGQAQYTLLLDEQAGVVDDLILYLRSDDDVLLVPNAANAAEVLRVVETAAPSSVSVVDDHDALAVIAVQGPRATEVVTGLGLPADLDYMAFTDASWHGTDVVVCRSGYTGERGFELLVPRDRAGELWDAVVEAGALPSGLGARDTLRTEMGYPLHGHELSTSISPLEARVSWAIGWDKPAFRGRDALVAQRSAEPRRMLWGLRAEGRGIPRDGMTVLAADTDDELGTVTSGTFSPTLRTGVALALLAPGVTEGTAVDVDVRGRRARFEVVRPPFVRSHVR